MKGLSPVEDDPLEIYDAIVSSKKPKSRRRRLERLRLRIRDAYLEYDKWKPELHRLRALGPRLSSRERDDLLDCYKAGCAARDRLYAKIRKLTSVCPYCTIALTTTLDHYLPKAYYPEFSILTVNLIPSCYSCNRSRDFRSSTGERALIHPYFDTIPNERLLVATIQMNRGLPEVEFAVDLSRCTDAKFAKLYKRHIDLLGLCESYSQWALTEHGLPTILSPSDVRVRGMTRAEVRGLLEKWAEQEEPRLGANHARVVLIRAVASSDEYLDYCLGGTS